jgi:hypothetical protein
MVYGFASVALMVLELERVQEHLSLQFQFQFQFFSFSVSGTAAIAKPNGSSLSNCQFAKVVPLVVGTVRYSAHASWMQNENRKCMGNLGSRSYGNRYNIHVPVHDGTCIFFSWGRRARARAVQVRCWGPHQVCCCWRRPYSILHVYVCRAHRAATDRFRIRLASRRRRRGSARP